MANDPNTYYAKPNEIVDGNKLASNITTIQGAGGNTVTISSGLLKYSAGPGNNNINWLNSGGGYTFGGNSSGNVIINLPL